MGARTWDFMVDHGSWPYGGKPTWIVTHADQLAELPGAEPIERHNGPLAEGTFPLRQLQLAELSKWGDEGARLVYRRA